MTKHPVFLCTKTSAGCKASLGLYRKPCPEPAYERWHQVYSHSNAANGWKPNTDQVRQNKIPMVHASKQLPDNYVILHLHTLIAIGKCEMM